jgi:hypothetical protein
MAKNVIFVSHCSQDREFTAHIFPHLESLERSLDVQVWTDVGDIRAGDQWNDEIADALDRACLAVLLISPKFLNSEFINGYEIPQLRRQAKSGLRIIPLHMMPGSWPDWIAATDMRPKGDRSLFEIRKADEAQFERQMAKVMDEIKALLKDQVGAAHERPDGAHDRRANMPSVKLLCDSVLRELPDGEDFARRIAAEIAGITGIAGEEVFNATRVFIEYHLLESSDPDNEATLELSPARGGEPPEPLLELLKQFGKTANPKDFAPYDVLSEFFNRTLKREAAWKRYFEAVAEHGGEPKESIASVLRVHAQIGYIAPQSLVAGLLARFDNEWRPVLDAYQSGIPKPKERNSAFESLQASQWNCWLMWGPSVPICTCEQWHGKFAFQYGFGDENNSLPVFELAADEKGLPRRLGALGDQLRAERRGAKVSELTARLRWGSWFLEEYKGTKAEKEFNLAEANRRKRRKQGLAKYPAAPAQMSLYQEASASGLVLQLDEAEAPKPQQETRVYFSAYYWLIFLVATPPPPGEAGKEGPALLRRKKYPEWNERLEDRQNDIVRDRLWQDLLPVFVHANIGDPEAFRFQRQVLVQNALQLLREVWSQRKNLFHADDVAAGIRFYLACASDYSGCGCPIRYAPERSLIQELRARLAAEPDREFAQAIQLPGDDEKPEDRPPGLAGYFSACHMPELIAGYYDHVEKISEPD